MNFSAKTPPRFDPDYLLWAIAQARQGTIQNDILFDFTSEWRNAPPGE